MSYNLDGGENPVFWRFLISNFQRRAWPLACKNAGERRIDGGSVFSGSWAGGQECPHSLLFHQREDRLRPDPEHEGGDGENRDAGFADRRKRDRGFFAGVGPPHGADDVEVVVKTGGGGDESDGDADPQLGFDGEREDEELADEAGGERDAGECG